ncbi:hypothetical protein PV08_01483 [Exophiala spinifera]|uniref:Elongin-A n=1 Tax=Exophiala spinifera TaxID=91928 RepID=A0A0D2CBK4_9EURO|nr:uncharacterized protein PV08_01483 [Exophiala spinifera]KIW20904.1 hypothetical protein PV08_01483 [Exophiala spinifera]
MPADSLLDICIRACAKRRAFLPSVGDLPYELVRPILAKIESPEHLHQIEQASPQIVGEDAELWLNFIKRDIPDWHLKPHQPANPKNWYKVYRKLQADNQRSRAQTEEDLKAAFANIQSEKERNTTIIAKRQHLPLQTPSRKAVIHWNYISGKTGSKGAHKMTLMEKIRKETRNARISKMKRPTHELQKRATTVKTAPLAFVEDVKRKAEAARPLPPPQSPPTRGAAATTTPTRMSARPTAPRTSRPPMHAPKPKVQPLHQSYDLTADREARLRALKLGGPRPTPPTPASAPTVQQRAPGGGGLTANFLEDSDDEDDRRVQQPRRGLKANHDDRRPPSTNAVADRPPQGQTLKRKQPPSMFMSTSKRVARPIG